MVSPRCRRCSPAELIDRAAWAGRWPGAGIREKPGRNSSPGSTMRGPAADQGQRLAGEKGDGCRQTGHTSLIRPEIPGVPRQGVARTGEDQAAVRPYDAAHVVVIAVGDHDQVDIVRSDAFFCQMVEQRTLAAVDHPSQAAHTGIDQDVQPRGADIKAVVPGGGLGRGTGTRLQRPRQIRGGPRIGGNPAEATSFNRSASGRISTRSLRAIQSRVPSLKWKFAAASMETSFLCTP